MNFGVIPEEYSTLENSKVAILPVPFDGTSTWVKGADKGPDAIFEASANMELFDIESEKEIYKIGIYTDEPVIEKRSPEKMVAKVEKKVTELLNQDKFVVTLGGEHSVSIGSILSHSKHFSDFSVLQLDAHADLREEYEGSKNNHACVMARAREKSDLVQVGIRSISEEEVIDGRSEVFFAHQMRNRTDWMEKAINSISTENVYLTIDLDVLDPSIMPSTGTPEPGGLLWYDLLDFLKSVFLRKNIVGFDVVELCPKPDNRAPDFLAAKLVYLLLGYKFFLKDSGKRQ